MSMKSALWLLAACVVAVVLSRSTGQAHPQNDSGPLGPLGVDFLLDPATGGEGFPCQVRVRSLVSGEGVLLEKFSVATGKETTFKKSSNGVEVDGDVTIAPGGASVLYHITLSTTSHKALGIYGALVKLHN
jgi:hypothetical protein